MNMTKIGLLAEYLREMRIKQWLKNVLVLAAIVFNGSLFSLDRLKRVSLMFGAFCLVSSAIYFFNDLIDVENDRLNPNKKQRPVASGTITKAHGSIVSLLLFLSGIAIATQLNRGCVYLLLVYVTINIAYTLKLKHVVIVDVIIIASGFVLRALAGAQAIEIVITPWFLLCVLFLSLCLGLGKRRQELYAWQNSEIPERRDVLHFYTLELIDQMMTIATSATIISYALFAVDPNTKNSSAMVATIPLVIYGVFYYLYLVRVKHDSDSPENIFFKEMPLLSVALVYGICIVFIRNF